MKSKYSLLLITLLWCVPTFAQVSVTPNCSLGKCQLFDRNGHPLASGKVYSYDPGTTNQRNTYKDSLGVSQNTDPIILDGGGYASIWLANQAYKFCVYSSSNVLQYPCIDNVSGYLGILNFANTWTFPQTFTSAITDTQTDNQFILGVLGVQTTLDFPPPAGPVTLHFPNTADTMIGRVTADSLSNKTFTDYPKVGTNYNTAAVLCVNTSEVTQTGDVAVHTIYTCAIPANAMGTTRQLRVTVMFNVTVAPGPVTVNVNYGGVRLSPAISGIDIGNMTRYTVLGGNNGATNLQSWDQTLETILGATPSGYGGHVTSAVDSTVNQNITVTFQGANAGCSATFHRVIVELL